MTSTGRVAFYGDGGNQERPPRLDGRADPANGRNSRLPSDPVRPNSPASRQQFQTRPYSQLSGKAAGRSANEPGEQVRFRPGQAGLS